MKLKLVSAINTTLKLAKKRLCFIGTKPKVIRDITLSGNKKRYEKTQFHLKKSLKTVY